MTPWQFKALRSSTGLSQKQFGELIGLAERTIRSFENTQLTRAVPKWLEYASIYAVKINRTKLKKDA